MVMSAADSTLFSFNEIATEIWEAADGRTPLGEIVRSRICAKFEASSEEAYRDAEEFVTALAQHGLLKISEQPIGESAGKDEAEL